MKYLCIDPSGSGITGLFCYNLQTRQGEFSEIKSSRWEEHFCHILNYCRQNSIQFIIYETTNYIHKRMASSCDLLKLIGGIVSLKYTFNFIQQVHSVAVNQVKSFKKQLRTDQKQIEGLTYQVGRGKGWKYNQVRINSHKLDALIIYHLWSQGSLESTSRIIQKITALKTKKRLGIRQKEELIKLEGFLALRDSKTIINKVL